MLNIPKKYVWRSTPDKKTATLHTATSLTVNSVTDIPCKYYKAFQTVVFKTSSTTHSSMSKSEHMLS